LSILSFGTAASALTGAGVLAMTSSTALSLGAADDVGVQFIHAFSGDFCR
jgi:hypothetical protein